jgi:2-amino-4-hydroxy-6-hydroxymethyldihydropteridine diphosphokinase
MARVYVSIGSNIDRERSVRAGVADLRQAFGELQLSSVYESEAVGFDGDDFFNLVAGFDTDKPVEEVATELRQIEDRHGRVRTGPRFSSRTLDIDLLLYDDLVIEKQGLSLPRDEITKNAFVLWPLAEIAPDAVHPVLKRAYGELWEAFDKQKQPLWPVPFQW